MPWTQLDLDDPIGRFTVPKLTRLVEDPAQCRALLREAQTGDIPVPPRRAGPSCGYEYGLRLASDDVSFSPVGPVTSCPVAAAMHLFETRVVQLAALRHFGSPVAVIDHAGTYSCRRLYGRSEGPYSEHATANAIDVLGFRLEDGTRVSVLRDWEGETSKSEFLREVRDGACRIFSTVLSPDYNAAHADHLHLDQARRGSLGWRVCR